MAEEPTSIPAILADHGARLKYMERNIDRLTAVVQQMSESVTTYIARSALFHDDVADMRACIKDITVKVDCLEATKNQGVGTWRVIAIVLSSGGGGWMLKMLAEYIATH